MFALFKRSCCVTRGRQETGHYGRDAGYFLFDAFFGLDRTKIRHAGLFAHPESKNITLTPWELEVRRLPSLRTLSVLTLGPASWLTGGAPRLNGPRGWAMPNCMELQLPECEYVLRDVTPHQLHRHPFYGDKALRAKYNDFRLEDIVSLTREVLYHDQSGPNPTPNLQWLEHFPLHQLSGSESDSCTLGCDWHTRADVRNWDPGFEMDVKLVCEEGWAEALDRAGIFDEAATARGDFDAFLALRDNTVARTRYIRFVEEGVAPDSD